MTKIILAATAAATLVLAAPQAHAIDIVTRTATLDTAALPATINFGQAFNDAQPGVAGLQALLSGVPVSLASGDRFVDLYGFTLGQDARASAVALTIDLGQAFRIGELRIRLLADAPAPAIGSPWSAAASPLAVGAPKLLDGLRPAQAIDLSALAAGSYLLEVSGEVAGSFGGSYSGVLNLAPVPEPGTAALWLAGLLSAGAAARRARLPA